LGRIAVYGAGGHAKTVLSTLFAQGRHEVAGILDDNQARNGTMLMGCPILGGREQVGKLRERGISGALVAIGDNYRRMELAALLEEAGLELVQAIHPSAIVLEGASIGKGCVVLPYAFIGVDAVVGDHVIVSVGVVVGHDCRVGSGAQLGPRAAMGGGSSLGDASFLGMGASVLPGIAIGRDTVVGANAVIRHDLPAGVTAVGVPGHIIKRRAEI
jgi:UDP-perosamine 4-acetyltransferase